MLHLETKQEEVQMRMQSNNPAIYKAGIESESSHLLDNLKRLFAELFATEHSSQDIALDLFQSSKGFDPLKNPQSLVTPRTTQRSAVPDKRLPVRRAA